MNNSVFGKKSLFAIEMKKAKVMMNKPVYLEYTILT